jgi:hypothetical protein
MNWNKPPVPVIVVARVYIAVGEFRGDFSNSRLYSVGDIKERVSEQLDSGVLLHGFAAFP